MRGAEELRAQVMLKTQMMNGTQTTTEQRGYTEGRVVKIIQAMGKILFLHLLINPPFS